MSRGRFAVFPPVGSHLFVTGSHSGFRKGRGGEEGGHERIRTRVRDRVEICVIDVFFADVNIDVISFLSVFF